MTWLRCHFVSNHSLRSSPLLSSLLSLSLSNFPLFYQSLYSSFHSSSPLVHFSVIYILPLHPPNHLLFSTLLYSSLLSSLPLLSSLLSFLLLIRGRFQTDQLSTLRPSLRLRLSSKPGPGRRGERRGRVDWDRETPTGQEVCVCAFRLVLVGTE